MRHLSPLPYRVRRVSRAHRIVAGKLAKPIADVYAQEDAEFLVFAPAMAELLVDLTDEHPASSKFGERIRRVLYEATRDECLLAEFSKRKRLDILAECHR